MVRRRGSYWRSPERLDGQDARDAAYRNRRYFVYILETRSGHYVGHTYSVRNRVAQHRRGQVPSTKGTTPHLVWKSRPYASRGQAADFEAALKSLRDQKHPRFQEITGHHPLPWVFNDRYRDQQPTSQMSARPADKSGNGSLLWIFIGVALVVLLLAAN